MYPPSPPSLIVNAFTRGEISRLAHERNSDVRAPLSSRYYRSPSTQQENAQLAEEKEFSRGRDFEI